MRNYADVFLSFRSFFFNLLLPIDAILIALLGTGMAIVERGLLCALTVSDLLDHFFGSRC